MIHEPFSKGLGLWRGEGAVVLLLLVCHGKMGGSGGIESREFWMGTFPTLVCWNLYIDETGGLSIDFANGHD